MRLTIPELALVVLMGPSGAGKSTFARRHFRPTEILSSDYCRGLVSDDENSLEATKDAFEVLHFIAGKRLAAGKLTVIDATNVQPESRKPLIALAREHHCLPVAIVLNLPERICEDRNRSRPDRDFGPHVIRSQRQQLRRSLRGLKREGFRHLFVMESVEEIEAVTIDRQPLWNNRRGEHGPFDIIGDIHGCCDELEELLARLGYEPRVGDESASASSGMTWRHPAGRKAIFLGDLGDRGPRILDVFRIVQHMVSAGSAYCVPGNHDIKLLRKLSGRNVQISHGLDRTLAELDALPEELRISICQSLSEFIDSLVSHYVFDDGKLVVAHAGLKEEMHGRGSGKVREFALYGETTGETDEFGLPVRYNWASEYRGRAMVVYGHTPVPEPDWLNRTINIDTGCVFGGKLTALRYPEKELVSVSARRSYCEPSKPFLEQPAPALSAQHAHDDLLDVGDVLGKLIVSTRLARNVTVREENALAALEVMSRFAINPKWLIYLPPTMSPCETSQLPGFLEHPLEAFAYYRQEGIPRVLCQEKHMGSRAVIVLGRDEAVVRRRFGLGGEGIGICYTRTGRRFFKDSALEAEFLRRLCAAAERSGLWDDLQTDWLCLDCELMPWSMKAQELIREQYAAVGAAAGVAMLQVLATLGAATDRQPEAKTLLERFQARASAVSRYAESYRRYCWPVQKIDDLKLAPFHLLACEGAVHSSRDHAWHLEVITRLCNSDPAMLHVTPSKLVDVTEEASMLDAVEWWMSLTARGGEGMVVKPLDFVASGRRGIAQPALKVRGVEYLRIIYGPEYSLPEHLERLRARGLSAKRSLAVREFALGIEALERFVRREPLRRVHECVFAVLALESEPVDPRL